MSSASSGPGPQQGAGSNSDCTCNDYSQLSANTGLSKIDTANSALDGTGTTSNVYTAASDEKGSIIKSITIKAIQPTLQGMVRLFIQNADASITTLYKEVPIPIQPQANVVPLPFPQYLMYEVKLEGGLKLNPGYSILASTQNTQTFNVIVEGIDWKYPEELPSSCCNFMQETGNTGINTVSTANTNLDGTGAITSVFTAGSSADGSLIKTITIKAMGSTHEGAVRIFVYDGTTWFLMTEVYIPQTTQSAFQPSFKQIICPNFWLQATYKIGVTTQISEPFAITIEGVDVVFPE